MVIAPLETLVAGKAVITAGSQALIIPPHLRSLGTIDCKLVFFSTREATKTSLASRGIQVLSMHSLAFNEKTNLSFGSVYNADSEMWEL